MPAVNAYPPPVAPDSSRPGGRRRWRFGLPAALGIVAFLLFCSGDYRPGDVEQAIAPYRFSIVSWELRHLPGKWLLRRAPATPAQVQQYFDYGRQRRQIGRRIIALEAQSPRAAAVEQELADLQREQNRLAERQAQLRPGVETALESAVADTLRSLGFGAATGVFPPVDTVLTGSPTVLVTSPRARIERKDEAILQPGLPHRRRAEIEAQVEAGGDRSALVVNTGGIAFYPSITLPDAGAGPALEIIAHEWAHHWLWFRPLGRRYFQGGDITAINETVADIAGKEIGALAQQRLRLPPAASATPAPAAPSAPSQPTPAPGRVADPPPFDFHGEMRVTRARVDALLAAGDIAGAEAYMEERRRVFVSNGYYIRRLNQAYFAFHGTYATTGAAGVSVIGAQVAELRRRSGSVAEFLRTAAGIASAGDLAALVE